MATPFGTRARRRAGVFVFLWAFVAAAIVVRSTTDVTGPLAAAVTPGVVYYQARVVLERFAHSAAVSPVVVLSLYAVLGLAVVTLAIYVLDNFAFESQEYVRSFVYDYGDGSFAGAMFVIYALVGIGLFFLLGLGSLYTGRYIEDSGVYNRIAPNLDVFTSALLFAVGVSPQFLTLAAFGLVIAFVTVYVP